MANIHCRSVKVETKQKPLQPPYTYLPPHHINGTLLPALTLNDGTGRKLRGAESSIIDVISRILGWTKYTTAEAQKPPTKS